MGEAISLILKDILLPSCEGDYLEFGVYQGASLLWAYSSAETLGYENMRFFGFDSFEGLPETEEIFKKGLFSDCSYEAVLQKFEKENIPPNKLFIIKGLFSDTLKNTIKSKYDIKKMAFGFLDADIYSSTIQALNFMTNIIYDGTILYFDDWSYVPDGGVNKAVSEFLNKNSDIRFEYLPFEPIGGKVCRVHI